MKSGLLLAGSAVIAAIAFPLPLRAEEKTYVERMREVMAIAKQMRVASDLRMFRTTLWTYQLHSGQLPTEEQGLKALMEKPSLAPLPRRWKQMLAKIPQDPWEHPYRYLVRDREGKKEHVLICDGPDLATKEDDREVIVSELPSPEKIVEMEVLGQLRYLQGTLQMYFTVCDALPTQEQGLAALQAKPTLEPVPKAWMQISKTGMGPDPWGRPYRYTVREQDGKKVQVLSSDGPDADNKADDIELVVDLGPREKE